MSGAPPAIYLDNLRFRDWRALYRIAKHPDFFYRALNDQSAWEAWRAAHYILKAKMGNHFPFMRRTLKAIRLSDTRTLVGCVVLVDLHKKALGQAETGTFVAAPYWGKKIGTAARLRFLDWCLENFDIQVIESMVRPDNEASFRMQERSGMKKVDFISAGDKSYFGRDGKPEPRIVMRGERAEIEAALRQAREQGLYSRTIPVL